MEIGLLTGCRNADPDPDPVVRFGIIQPVLTRIPRFRRAVDT